MEPIEDKLYNSKVVNLWVMDESSICVWSEVLLSLEKYHLSSSKKPAAQ